MLTFFEGCFRKDDTSGILATRKAAHEEKCRRHTQRQNTMTMSSPIRKANTKGSVTVKQVAVVKATAIVTAAMMMAEVAAVMAAVTAATMTAAMIAPTIPIGVMMIAKAAQTIRSVATVKDAKMTGSASTIAIMMLITSMMKITLRIARLAPHRGNTLEEA